MSLEDKTRIGLRTIVALGELAGAVAGAYGGYELAERLVPDSIAADVMGAGVGLVVGGQVGSVVTAIGAVALYGTGAVTAGFAQNIGSGIGEYFKRRKNMKKVLEQFAEEDQQQQEFLRNLEQSLEPRDYNIFFSLPVDGSHSLSTAYGMVTIRKKPVGAVLESFVDFGSFTDSERDRTKGRLSDHYFEHAYRLSSQLGLRLLGSLFQAAVKVGNEQELARQAFKVTLADSFLQKSIRDGKRYNVTNAELEPLISSNLRLYATEQPAPA